MTDVFVVVGLIVAFALLAGFVTVCQRIIGADPEGVQLSTGARDLAGEEDEIVDASAHHAAHVEVTA